MSLLNEDDGDYVVVIGVFARRDFDDVQRQYPALVRGTYREYITQTETMARAVQEQGGIVEIAVIDFADFDAWCHYEGIDPEHGDSRARYLTAAEPPSFPLDDSLSRILDCDIVAEMAASEYAALGDLEAIDKVTAHIDEQCESLLASVNTGLTRPAMLTIAANGGMYGDPGASLTFAVTTDDDGDLCLSREVDTTALVTLCHLAMLRGGFATRRVLRDGVCEMTVYSLGDRAWRGLSSLDAETVRYEADAGVGAVGGQVAYHDADSTTW